MTDADTDYQSPVPPDEQINPNPAPPLPGDGGMATGDSLLPQQPGASQGILGTPTAPTADPWTITDVPADAPDETQTVQPPDSESAQE